jgi:serine/threonine-protein kinase
MPADPKFLPPDGRPETTEAEFLARVRFEFGELLKFTPPVPVEKYLANLPAKQQALALPALLELDLAWADDWGQPRPACDEYVARLPEFETVVRSFFAQRESYDRFADLEDTGEVLPPDETQKWRRGLRLGCYELLDQLGQGGFGEVWKCRNHNDGSLVAIKSVGPTRRKGELKSSATIANHRNYLVREREILRELSELDVRVPKLLDQGLDGSGRPYVVMQLVPGRDLQQRRDVGEWPWRRCVQVTISIAQALRDLHRQGYYHCDLKTRNIVLDLEDQAWLIDMGSTMRYSDVVERGRGYFPPYTRGYAPPEAEAEGDSTQINARYDLHMLGAVLYVLLTGRPPGPEETLLRHKYNDHREQLAPQPPSEIHPGLPGVVADVCLGMLEKSSEERPRNAQEVITRLERALHEEPDTDTDLKRRTEQRPDDPVLVPTRDARVSSTAKVEESTQASTVPTHLVSPEPSVPPPAPPRGGGPRRMALAGAGGALGLLLALALAISGRESESPPSPATPGHTILFDLGPRVAPVQGQFAPPSLKRSGEEFFEAQLGYPFQVLVGSATESQRKYAVDFEMTVTGPTVGVGITFAPQDYLEPHACTKWWMFHLQRLPSESENISDADWDVRLDRYALTNPIPQELKERVAEGTLILGAPESQPLGRLRLNPEGPSFRVTLVVAESRLIEAHVNGEKFALDRREEDPLFLGDLAVLAQAIAPVPDENGRPRPPGMALIRKPRFRYVD